jgi:flagellar basal-body rod protein FlgG
MKISGSIAKVFKIKSDIKRDYFFVGGSLGINFNTFFGGLKSSIDIINRSANNIANLNTKGFKSTNSLTGKTDFSTSTFLFTGQKLDLGIEGEGFFKLTSQEGKTIYTRNGNFSLNSEGKIVDPNGNFLDSDLKINPNQPFAINEDGSVYQNNKIIGKIDIYDFSGKQEMIKVRGGYIPTIGQNPSENSLAKITSGNLETSNSDIATEQVSQIIGTTSYEANIKGMKVIDEILGEVLDIKV